MTAAKAKAKKPRFTRTLDSEGFLITDTTTGFVYPFISWRGENPEDEADQLLRNFEDGVTDITSFLHIPKDDA